MPITFIDIERQKNWKIGCFFLVLILLYFVIALALSASFFEIFSIGFTYNGFLFNARTILTVFFFAIITASFHFYLSTINAVSYIRRSLGAQIPDPEDAIHKRLTNIIDEIRAASGSRARIECLVIPSLSMNALSAVDFKGNAIIAITEGLLSRISRDRLEAVIAHEACHILSGDCLESTVAASLFGVPSAAMEKISNALEGRIFFSPAFLIAWLMVRLSYLLNMFISREREYRADAGAVRMTRNPLALAEVLYLLSRSWRGTGHIGMGLEMLCFMNTSISALDESEGWFADLMSTHPPVRKRINVLLKMARAGISELKKNTASDRDRAAVGHNENEFYALDNMNQWQGPFSFFELAAVPWLTPLTWVSKDGQNMEKASHFPVISTIFRVRLNRDEKMNSPFMCPSCRHNLIKKPYEGTSVYQCKFCGGMLVEDNRLPRIIARSDTNFSERIRALSMETLRKNQLDRIARNKKKANEAIMPLLPCPKCGDNMVRTFYSQAYLVETDRCTTCNITWFDYDELEMLQCMIDNKMASVPMPLYARENCETIPSV